MKLPETRTRPIPLAWNELWHAPNMPEIIRHVLLGGTS